jgi:hypothetical protein
MVFAAQAFADGFDSDVDSVKVQLRPKDGRGMSLPAGAAKLMKIVARLTGFGQIGSFAQAYDMKNAEYRLCVAPAQELDFSQEMYSPPARNIRDELDRLKERFSVNPDETRFILSSEVVSGCSPR